jgi:hypothetical protein
MAIRISEQAYSKLRGKEPSKKRPYNSYLPKRADRNQPEIVDTLRKLGFMVHHLHEVGSGMFDLLIEKYGLHILVEVKDGLKPPSGRELTKAQRRFHFAWRGMRCVVICKQDCMRLSEQVNAIARQLRLANIDLRVTGCEELQYQVRLYV